MQEELAAQAAADRNYTGVDPELPSVDRFIRGTINSLQSQDEEVHAFVRAGLFRSFTARKVLLLLLQQVLAYQLVEASSQHETSCSSPLLHRCTISPLPGMFQWMAELSPFGKSLGTLVLPSSAPALAQTSQQDDHRQMWLLVVLHADQGLLSRIMLQQQSCHLLQQTKPTTTMHTIPSTP